MQNEDHIQCPSCGHRCRIRREHMGRRVGCPKCKTAFAVPPPPPISHATESVTEEATTDHAFDFAQPPRKPSIPKPQSNAWRRPSTIIAFLMLGITLLLPVSMIAMAMFTVAPNDRGEDLGNGMYMRTDARGLPDIGWQSDRDAGLGFAALLTGVCCPLVPYVIFMLILGIAYFAFRSAGS